MKVEWGSDNFMPLRPLFQTERAGQEGAVYFLHRTFSVTNNNTTSTRRAHRRNFFVLLEHTMYICHVPICNLKYTFVMEFLNIYDEHDGRDGWAQNLKRA